MYLFARRDAPAWPEYLFYILLSGTLSIFGFVKGCGDDGATTPTAPSAPVKATISVTVFNVPIADITWRWETDEGIRGRWNDYIFDFPSMPSRPAESHVTVRGFKYEGKHLVRCTFDGGAP